MGYRGRGAATVPIPRAYRDRGTGMTRPSKYENFAKKRLRIEVVTHRERPPHRGFDGADSAGKCRSGHSQRVPLRWREIAHLTVVMAKLGRGLPPCP